MNMRSTITSIIGIAVTSITNIVAKITGGSKKCVWYDGEPCVGEVAVTELMSGQLIIPICDKHFQNYLKFTSTYRKIFT